MDRRKYLKSITLGTLGAGVILESCNTEKASAPEAAGEAAFTIDRYPEELAREKELLSEKFLNEHEMKTIAVLSDIIIPKDDVSGSATEAGVPAFIEFIVKDMPHHQLPVRGGLKWLDLQCMKNFNNAFVNCPKEQQIQIIDQIAFPELAKPEMQQGVAFFNLMRNLTATGFFTSKMGIKDLGYMGNQPNQWDGVPQDVLQQYGMKYDAKTLEVSVKHNS
jgi:gluconate 2-dehydrogenase gamma chain